MGRQAYLAKIAFGRSAFEPTQDITQSGEYVQLESSQTELPSQYQDFNGNNYIQLYDERGNPINPRSHEYGKRLRNAQNDVLAAVGVVERRQSPPQGVSGSYAARLEELDDEDHAGNTVTRMIPLTGQMCTYWAGTIGARLLTFQYDDALSLTQIIASEISTSGRSIMYTGIVSRIFSALCARFISFNVLSFRPIDRIALALNAGSKTRKFLRQSRWSLTIGLHVAIEMAIYPLAYYGNLQRLGLIPARPFLPGWRAFGFFYTSPQLPFLPIFFISVERVFERWLHAVVSKVVKTSIIRPDNPDVVRSNIDSEDQLQADLGSRRGTPSVVRSLITRLMTALGWTEIDVNKEADYERRREPQLQIDHPEQPTVNGTTIENLRPVDIPVVQGHDDARSTAEAVPERPTTPPSPTLLHVRLDDEDPRIRITNREGIVEMEVRLPPRVLSAHTNVLSSPQERQVEPSRETGLAPNNRPYHRVSILSTGPSTWAGTITVVHFVTIATIPMRMIILRLIASHYLAGQGGRFNSQRLVGPLFSMKDLSWRSVGVQVSRIALCSGLQVAIDIALWGLQYVTTVKIGKGLFGWGTL